MPTHFLSIGAYSVRRLLGEGSSGWVFEVEREGFRLALKLLKPRSLQSGQEADFGRFEQEIRILSSLKHPALVDVLDAGAAPRVCVADGSSFEAPFFCAMPLLEGSLAARLGEPSSVLGPLGRREDPPGRLSLAEMERVFVPLLSALEALHARGVVHRDIKPTNLLLDRDGHAYLSDLGLAPDLHTSDTRGGTLLGTPLWVSPEQAAASKEVGPRSDLFSLGLVLYRALVGRHAYDLADGIDGADRHAIQLQLVRAALRHSDLELRFPDPRTCPGAGFVSRALQSVVRKATRIAPSARYASAAAFRDDLQRALLASASPLLTLEQLMRVGPYAVRRLIGEGRFAWVFEVEHAGEARALKIFKPTLPGVETDAIGACVRRSLESARTVQETLPVLDVFPLLVLQSDGGAPCVAPIGFSMPLARTLSERNLGPPGAPRIRARAVELLQQLVDALARLHRRGLVHGDIRPANLWLDDRGRARLGDLRIAALGAGDEPTAALREERIWNGPEGLLGTSLTCTSDVLAMGMSAWGLLGGGGPLEWLEDLDPASPESVAQWLRAWSGAALPVFEAAGPVRSERLEELLRKAIGIDPSARLTDARALSRGLERALQPTWWGDRFFRP